MGNEVQAMTTTRPLRADEGLLLKQLRLGALKESPDSFSLTWEEASVNDDEYWIAAAKRIADSPDIEIFIAEDEGEAVGLVSGEVDREGAGHIGAMWASPVVRGKGVGRQLMATVMAYLAQQGCGRIELSVTETNQVAINMYKNLGFHFTGIEEPLREGSSLMNLTMARVAP